MEFTTEELEYLKAATKARSYIYRNLTDRVKIIGKSGADDERAKCIQIAGMFEHLSTKISLELEKQGLAQTGER